MVLPIVGWVLPCQSSAKALPQRLGHSLPDEGNSSVELHLPRGLKIVSSWQQKSMHYTFLVFPICGRQKDKRKKVAAKLLQSPRPSVKKTRLLDKFCVYVAAFSGQQHKSAPQKNLDIENMETREQRDTSSCGIWETDSNIGLGRIFLRGSVLGRWKQTTTQY